MEMLESIVFSSTEWLLVFARMGGLLGMNPLLSRRNIPAMVRTGLTFMMSALIVPTLDSAATAQITNTLDLAAAMLLELFVGLACGIVFQIFYYMLFFAGDMLDMQFGMSMAKVFDPGTNIQASVSGNLLNIFFVLYIFVTNSHLVMIRAFAASFKVLPIGTVKISPDAAEFIVEIFISAFSMAMRLAAPFIAAIFVLELSMGVLMKLIPQIHIFVINIQFKMGLGLLLLLAFGSPIASFIDNYMRIMMENIQRAFVVLGG